MRSFASSADRSPSTEISPGSGNRIDMIIRMVVVLPAPLGPYEREWPDRGCGRQPSLLIVNLDYRNTEHAAMRSMIEAINPDLLLLVELDERWASALAGLRGRYDHHLGVVRGEGLGLALWSRLPIEDGRVRHLVHEDRASLWATLTLPDGRPVRFVGVHPTPPGLEKSARRPRRPACR
jgi:endonuclease/exonuclease/phosphatase (EEP) superfamily protein YafD